MVYVNDLTFSIAHEAGSAVMTCCWNRSRESNLIDWIHCKAQVWRSQCFIDTEWLKSYWTEQRSKCWIQPTVSFCKLCFC